MQLSYLSHIEMGKAACLKTGWLFAHRAHLVVDDRQGKAMWARLHPVRRGLGAGWVWQLRGLCVVLRWCCGTIAYSWVRLSELLRIQCA
jgi:hypothetical protein